MLLILELLYLVAGLWLVISGKLPVGIFRFLFGKAEYELSSPKARLFGLLLLSPLPVSLFVSAVLSTFLGARSTGLAVTFEYIYDFVIILLSIVIARKSRLPEPQGIDNAHLITPPSEHRIKSYGLRLLMMIGIVILGCATITSFGLFLMVAISSITVGMRVTGNFWSDIFPFILMIAITGIGLFGVIKLIQLLREKT